MPIYILSPYISSGAPEALHQLCHHLNTIGLYSYIVYFDKQRETGYDLLYQDMYPNIKESKTIEDGSVVIFFEIVKYTIIEKLYSVKNCRYMLWWLSINNAIMFNTMETNLQHPRMVHLFHGEFIKKYILPLLTHSQPWYYLHDYIDTDIFNEGTFVNDDIVAFNPSKDCLSAPLLIPRKYRTLPLIDLDRPYFIHTLQKCKVYLDLGAHNGRDRIPREAALLGCVIITNRFGSAEFEEDIDIPEECKVTKEGEALELIEKIFKDYSYYYKIQQQYRDGLLLDKNRFVDQLRYIVMDYFYQIQLLPSIVNNSNELLHYNYNLVSQQQLYRDIAPMLYEFMQKVDHVTELGGETRSFMHIFLYGLSMKPSTSKTYTYVHPNHFSELEIYKHKFSKGDIICHQLFQDYLEEIPTTDMLFINTWHIYGQLKRELSKHHSNVTKYIILTNTILDGEEGESLRLENDIELESNATGYSIDEIKIGVRKAIHEFVENQNKKWKIILDTTYHYGMVVLEKI